MSDEPRNNAGGTRGRPFEPGNPGRPKGARNKATLAAEALLDGQAVALTQRAIDAAMTGDATALRLCLDRIIPPRRDRPVSFSLPAIDTVADAAKAMGAVLAAVASGDVTPAEAAEVAKIVETYTRALELHEFERRLAALEERAKK